VSSGYIPPKDELGPRSVLQALQKALSDDSRLKRSSSEEVARQLDLRGNLQEKPSSSLVAEAVREPPSGSDAGLKTGGSTTAEYLD
jgi:hypothetical protein